MTPSRLAPHQQLSQPHRASKRSTIAPVGDCGMLWRSIAHGTPREGTTKFIFPEIACRGAPHVRPVRLDQSRRDAAQHRRCRGQGSRSDTDDRAGLLPSSKLIKQPRFAVAGSERLPPIGYLFAVNSSNWSVPEETWSASSLRTPSISGTGVSAYRLNGSPGDVVQRQ